MKIKCERSRRFNLLYANITKIVKSQYFNRIFQLKGVPIKLFYMIDRLRSFLKMIEPSSIIRHFWSNIFNSRFFIHTVLLSLFSLFGKRYRYRYRNLNSNRYGNNFFQLINKGFFNLKFLNFKILKLFKPIYIIYIIFFG
jgi:hypothetical protein